MQTQIETRWWVCPRHGCGKRLEAPLRKAPRCDDHNVVMYPVPTQREIDDSAFPVGPDAKKVPEKFWNRLHF